MDANGGPEKPDKVEIWGRRIGRTLSYVLLIILVVYLYKTYLAP
jgi:hypothetical protein